MTAPNPTDLRALAMELEGHEWHGCAIGDCPHDNVQDCATALAAALREVAVSSRAALSAAADALEQREATLLCVRDAIKFAANSEGGLVAEIDAAMSASEEKP